MKSPAAVRFAGRGKNFAISLQPGAETSRYSINFSDPYFLETDYFFSTSGSIFEREREDYDEERTGATVSIGKRFGDVWSASVALRAEDVSLSNLAADAPVDVYNDVATGSLVTGVGFSVTRNSTDSSIIPTTGSRAVFGVEQVGAIGGDFDFTHINAEYAKFWTVHTDFLDRKSVVSTRIDLGYIPQSEDGVPVFERYYAGGNTFRGFDYRGIGPRGIRNDNGLLGEEAVGATWRILWTLQYRFPLAEEALQGVIFTDQGTLTNEPGFEDWRVTVGAGLRIKVPLLGQAPFAIDFAIPLVEQDNDQTRMITFNLDLPFR